MVHKSTLLNMLKTIKKLLLNISSGAVSKGSVRTKTVSVYMMCTLYVLLKGGF